MALLAIDQRFVENLEHVGLDLIEAETANVHQDSPDKRLALGFRDDPIKKVALGRTEYAGGFECGSGKHVTWIVVAKAEHSQRDCLRYDHQKGMLEE